MREGVMVGLIGLAGSTVLVVAGLMSSTSSQRRRWSGAPLIWLGVVGLLISAGWLVLGFYIDAVVR